MRKKPRTQKQRRTTLDSLIARAETDCEKRLLAFYGPNAKERLEFINSLALLWRTLRNTEGDKELSAGRNALYTDAKGRLDTLVLSAMWHNHPELLEALALAMRRVTRGDFDPRINFGPRVTMDHSRALLLLGASPDQLAKAITKDIANANAEESAKRTLKRIKARWRTNKK